MPRAKRDLHDWPSLNLWLYSIGLDDDHIRKYFFYTALVNYFPGSVGGSHRVPTSEEIKNEQQRLVKTINSFKPDLIVPIGKLSLAYCLRQKAEKLKDFIGKSFNIDPYGALQRKMLVIPLPHPSGASTWRHSEDNKALLKKALNLLKANLF